jgi:hypothetical protein
VGRCKVAPNFPWLLPHSYEQTRSSSVDRNVLYRPPSAPNGYFPVGSTLVLTIDEILWRGCNPKVGRPSTEGYSDGVSRKPPAIYRLELGAASRELPKIQPDNNHSVSTRNNRQMGTRARSVDPKPNSSSSGRAQSTREKRGAALNLGSRASNDFVIRITAPRSEPLIAAG